MEYFFNKFIEMIRYAPYLKDEKIKIQQFLSYLSYPYRNRIEYDYPTTLGGTIRKDKCCNEQYMNKTKHLKNYKEKKKGKWSREEKDSNLLSIETRLDKYLSRKQLQ